MNENTEVPPPHESGGWPETVPKDDTSLLVETKTLPQDVKSGVAETTQQLEKPADDTSSLVETKTLPQDEKSGVAETTQQIEKTGTPVPDPTKSTGLLVKTTQKTTLPEVVKWAGPLLPVPPESTSSEEKVGGLIPIKGMLSDKEVEIPIQGIDINTGQMINVAFSRHIEDPAVESFEAPEPEIPKDIPYSTSRSTNFTHFDVPSKQQKKR